MTAVLAIDSGRQLDQDPVHLRIVVQIIDQPQQSGFSRALGQVVGEGIDPDFLAGGVATHIHCEAGSSPTLTTRACRACTCAGYRLFDGETHPGLDLAGQRPSVNQLCGHAEIRSLLK
jgi:hypothetical protein